jgi:hypothetical protein
MTGVPECCRFLIAVTVRDVPEREIGLAPEAATFTPGSGLLFEGRDSRPCSASGSGVDP